MDKLKILRPLIINYLTNEKKESCFIRQQEELKLITPLTEKEFNDFYVLIRKTNKEYNLPKLFKKYLTTISRVIFTGHEYFNIMNNTIIKEDKLFLSEDVFDLYLDLLDNKIYSRNINIKKPHEITYHVQFDSFEKLLDHVLELLRNE